MDAQIKFKSESGEEYFFSIEESREIWLMLDDIFNQKKSDNVDDNNFINHDDAIIIDEIISNLEMDGHQHQIDFMKRLKKLNFGTN